MKYVYFKNGNSYYIDYIQEVEHFEEYNLR